MSPKTPNLTERTRTVLELARAVSTQLGQSSVTRLHVAVGILREGEGVAATALRYHGVALDQLAKHFTQLATDDSVPRETPGETQPSEIDALIASAHVEAVAVGHVYVGTEHLLLALLRDRKSLAAQALANYGLTYDEAKARILWILTADPKDPAPFVRPSAV